MHEIIQTISDEARNAWRFRWRGLAVAFLVALAGWAVVLSLPDRYEGSASVFVDTRTALKPVLEGLIVEDDVISQLGYVRQSLLSRPRLEKVAVEAGLLPPTGPTAAQRAQVVSTFASQVSIEAQQASADAYESSGTIYSITYQDRDSDRAARVTRTVMETFISDTLGGKQESTENTQKFLLDQIKVYEERLREGEGRLAEFKKKNMGLMPTDRGDYFSMYQGELDAGKKAQNDLDVAQARRAELARQLRGESVIGASSMVYGQGSGGDTASRIREAQARVDELSLRFTDRHPDVVEARNSLRELQARREAEIESLRRGDAGSAAVTGLANNPLYQSIQLQLNQVDVEIASLRGQVAQHNIRAAELRKLLDTAPLVEAEYAQLNRDYDINKSQYTALLANLDKARLGESADNAGGVRFQIVQPPNARLVSASGHRNLLLGAVLLAAVAAGGAVAYLFTLLRPVVSSVRDLGGVTGLPVLGVVSAAFPRRIQSEARWAAFRFSVAASLLVAGIVAVLVLNANGFSLARMSGG